MSGKIPSPCYQSAREPEPIHRAALAPPLHQPVPGMLNSLARPPFLVLMLQGLDVAREGTLKSESFPTQVAFTATDVARCEALETLYLRFFYDGIYYVVLLI